MNPFSQIHRPHISSAQIHPPVQIAGSSNRTCSHLLTALAIITLVGSLITAGVLYSHIGTVAFCIGGTGAFFGGGLLLITFLAKKNTSNNDCFNSGSNVQNMNPIDHSSNLVLDHYQTKTPPSGQNPMSISNLLNTTPQPNKEHVQSPSKEHKKIIDLTIPRDDSHSSPIKNPPSNTLNSTVQINNDEIIYILDDSEESLHDKNPARKKNYALSKTDLFSDDFMSDYPILISAKYPEKVSIPRLNKAATYLKDLSDLENLQQRILEHAASKPGKITPFFLNVEKIHWTLVLIDANKRHIEYYDSLKNFGNYKQISLKLEETAKKLSEQDPNQIPYKFIPKIKERLQNDGYQCGAWALYFLERIVEDPTFDPNSLPSKQRSKIIADYRPKVVDQLNEMSDKLHAAEKEEKSRYNNKQKYNEDKKKFSLVELWQNRLNGKLLTPTS